MGCICNHNQIIEQKLEYNPEIIKNKINKTDEIYNFNEITTNNNRIEKEEEIDTTVFGYPELVLKKINQIRQNPKEYSDIIEKSINNIEEEINKKNPKNKKLIYKSNVKVLLRRGEPAFKEAANELKNIEPMDPLIFREENCLSLPDNIEDYFDSQYLIDKVKEKEDDNIHINIFFKENVSVPEISVLLMIVDDRNRIDVGKKRRAILNKDFKYIGITSKFIDDTFMSYYSFSKE